MWIFSVIRYRFSLPISRHISIGEFSFRCYSHRQRERRSPSLLVSIPIATYHRIVSSSLTAPPLTSWQRSEGLTTPWLDRSICGLSTMYYHHSRGEISRWNFRFGLNPFLNDRGVLRLGGWLQRAMLSYGERLFRPGELAASSRRMSVTVGLSKP